MAKVLIIGLGHVGMGYDLKAPDSQTLSHCKAFYEHPFFDLIAAVDPDKQKRNQFEKTYSTPAFSSLKEVSTIPDVIVISTPTATHGNVFENVFQYFSPRIILVEKPFSYQKETAQKCLQLASKNDCKVFVNYPRRSLPESLVVQSILKENAPENAKGMFWYSKGLMNGASHFINLLEMWFGKVAHAECLAQNQDWQAEDPQFDFLLSFETGVNMYGINAQSNHYFYNAVEIMLPSGRLFYEEGGATISWQATLKHPTLSQYTILAEPSHLETDLLRTQWHVAEQLAQHCKQQPTSLCSGHDALQTLNTLHNIKEHAK